MVISSSIARLLIYRLVPALPTQYKEILLFTAKLGLPITGQRPIAYHNLEPIILLLPSTALLTLLIQRVGKLVTAMTTFLFGLYLALWR